MRYHLVPGGLPLAVRATRWEQKARERRRSRIRRILRASWTGVPTARRAADLLRTCLRGLDGVGRERLLASPFLAGWIHDVLFWKSVRDLAERIATRRTPPGAENLLFERIAETEFLVELVPSGRLDGGFAARVRRRATRELWERMTDLSRRLLSHLPPGLEGLNIPLFFRELPDEGCPGDRIRLGESPVWLVWKAGPPPMALKVAVRDRSLVFEGPLEVARHETVPGTGILLAHRILSAPESIRVGGPVPGLGKKLSRALGLIETVWPRAAAEIRRRTWLVVPLVEPGTVSYSQRARPGISYINVFRGTLLDLADDLLHEAAHHRLHAREEADPLVGDEGEPVYPSPWRGAPRPLRGILHGTFTFLFRAELFLRLARAARSGRMGGLALGGRQRGWIEEEARKELANCQSALAHLQAAGREGCLTEEGMALVRRMRRRRALLSGPRLSLKSLFSIL